MKKERLLKYGFIIPTREYMGGILGGFGLGIVSHLANQHTIAPLFIAFGCVAAGSILARSAQRQRFQKESGVAKPVV